MNKFDSILELQLHQHNVFYFQRAILIESYLLTRCQIFRLAFVKRHLCMKNTTEEETNTCQGD